MLSAAIRASEQAFDGVVVELDPTVIDESRQTFPS